MTHFIVMFALLQLSGTEPEIPPRYVFGIIIVPITLELLRGSNQTIQVVQLTQAGHRLHF